MKNKLEKLWHRYQRKFKAILCASQKFSIIFFGRICSMMGFAFSFLKKQTCNSHSSLLLVLGDP